MGITIKMEENYWINFIGRTKKNHLYMDHSSSKMDELEQEDVILFGQFEHHRAEHVRFANV